MKDILLIPVDEAPDDNRAFQDWYAGWSKKLGLNPDPDDPRHHYDYRAAYRAGVKPDASGHWPSQFKDGGHPNLIVNGVDTRTGSTVKVKGEQAGLVDIVLEPVDEPPSPIGKWKAGALGLAAGMTDIAQSVGTGLQWAGERLGSDRLKEAGKTTEQYWGEAGKRFEPPKELQGAIAQDLSLLGKGAWWTYNVMRTAPSFAASMIPGAGAYKFIKVAGKVLPVTEALILKLAKLGAAVTGGASGGALEGTGTYQEIKEKGGTDAEAAAGAEMMTLASAALNAISVGKIMSPGVAGRVKHAFKSAGVESLTEYLEEPSEAGILYGMGKITGEEAIDKMVEGLNVVPPSAILGGGAGMTTRRYVKEGGAPPPPPSRPPPPPVPAPQPAPIPPAAPPAPPSAPENRAPSPTPAPQRIPGPGMRTAPPSQPGAMSGTGGVDIELVPEGKGGVEEIEEEGERNKQEYLLKILTEKWGDENGYHPDDIRAVLDYGITLPDLIQEYEKPTDQRTPKGKEAVKWLAFLTDARAEAEERKRIPEPTPKPKPTPIPSPVPPESATGDRIPEAKIAEKVKGHLGGSEDTGLDSKQLYAWADEAYGGTQAAGKYVAKDAYDAMELGVNQHIRGGKHLSPTVATAGEAKGAVSRLKRLIGRLPTQTKRSGESDEFQQFSTPPPLAFAANWVANIREGETYLEPSAGIGGLAVFGKLAGAKVIGNELSKRRARILREMGLDAVFEENAEQINNVLPKDVRPSVAVMNPPFSATGGRVQKKSSKYGFRHVDQALKRLLPNGRLVAILGEGAAPDTQQFRKWWRSVSADGNYALRANVGLSGKEYAKYGTTFGNRILVIDKVSPDDRAAVTGEADTVEALIDLLKEARDGRAEIRSERDTGKPPEAKPGGKKVPGTGGGKGILKGAGSALRAPTGSVGDGSRGDTGSGGSGEHRVPGADEAQGQKSGDEVPGTDPTGGDARPDGRRGDGGRSGGEHPGPDRGPSRSEDRPGQDGAAPEGAGLLTISKKERESETEEISDSIFEAYKPSKLEVKGAKPHPAKLVESAAMAAVEPPDPTYSPHLPQGSIEAGKVSLAQLEAVVYAGQSHAEMLADGSRAGFFIGDGTGVGKGREIAAILLDNWRQGRKKGVWISQNSPLFEDAKRDIAGIGWDSDVLFDMGSTTKLTTKGGGLDAVKRDEGIAFLGYDTLKSKSKEVAKRDKISRVNQIVQWVGEDFDGVIVFDESHNMGNAIEVNRGRYRGKVSQRAIAGMELQQRLPKARIVYVSATGATEVMNLAYAERLGLWGDGTAFPRKVDFVQSIEGRGIGAMEIVAQNMKATGHYLARSLSYDGIKVDPLEHKLTPEQRSLYDELAEAWQIVLREFEGALKTTGGANDSKARRDVRGRFWTTHQRFFSQVVASMQMPAVLETIQKDIDAGHSVVLQIVNTNQADQERALAKIEEEEEVEDLDLTPKEQLMDLVRTHFPVAEWHEVSNEEGQTHWEIVRDSEGNIVENEEAVENRDALLDRLGAIRGIEGPLEQVIKRFGAKNIAEITGRTRRVITNEEGKAVIERRSKAKCMNEADEFMNDRRRILIFSYAGGTGRSFHADMGSKNQRLRRHYLLQAGWRADRAVQGFGRSHRTNQKQPPEYVLVTTDIPGHKRFISTIARRLSQLGALTRGQREAGSSGFFGARDNLENKYAADAVDRVIRDMHGGEVEGMSLREFVNQTGLSGLIDDYGGLNVSAVPTPTQFLNRVLSMTLDSQGVVFDAFMARIEKNVLRAIAEGTLDVGMETIRGKRIKTAAEQVVYTQEKTGAQVKYVSLDVTNDAKNLAFEEVARSSRFEGFVRNRRSGQVWAISTLKMKTDHSTGDVTRYHVAIGPRRTTQDIAQDAINDAERYERLSKGDAKKLWDAEFAGLPTEVTARHHLITGALLLVMDRLPTATARLMRAQTDAGERYLGQRIPEHQIDDVLRRLGAGRGESAIGMTPKEMHHAVLAKGFRLTLANGWQIVRRKVSGEWRIEIVGVDYNFIKQLTEHGAFTERIGWDTRIFIPTTEAGVGALEWVTKNWPAVSSVASARVEAGRDTVTLDFMGGQQLAEAVGRLIKRINPKAAANVGVKGRKKGLGVVKGLLASPSTIKGKARYYVVHGKNAILKQDRLRRLAQERLDKIFGGIKTKAHMEEFEALSWMGDAEGREYTPGELDAMGVSAAVKEAYLDHRRFHDKVWRFLSAHRRAWGGDPGAGLEGHIPHLFENWNVYEIVERESTGPESEPGPILGTFRSLREATNYANSLDPAGNYRIQPKAFRLPDHLLAKTVLSDTSYFTMIENVEREFQVTPEEARGMVSALARRKGRHRQFGNMMRRKGQTGFRKDDLPSILRQYYYSAARYVALDDFKARVTPKFERDFGAVLGRANTAVRDKNLARYIEGYIDTLNGVPGMLEELLNASIMQAPFLGKLARSERPAIWAANKAMHITATLKLGLWNLSAGFVNLTQLTNTFSQMPFDHFSWAFRRVLGGKLSGAEKALLRRLGVETDLGLADAGGYSAIHKGGAAMRANMFFFQKAECLNRSITALAAYRWGKHGKGMDNKQARTFARHMVDRTQFDYSVADSSRIFRGPTGRLLGQFKPFAIKQVEFILGLKGTENVKFWIPMLLLSGLGGVPLAEGMSDFIAWLTGVDPIKELKAFAFRWAGGDKDRQAVVKTALYGLLANVGIDVSRRVGLGDALPNRATDLLGPTISTILQAKSILEMGDKTELIRSLTPSLGNIATALETIANDMEVRDPYHRDRKKYDADAGDVLAKATGLRPLKEAMLSDAENIRRYESDKYSRTLADAVDAAIESLRKGDAEGFAKAIQDAAAEGVILDDKAIRREIVAKALPPEVRALLATRKMQRGNYLELTEILD